MFAIDVMDGIAALASIRVSYRVLDDFTEVVEEMRDARIDIIPNSGIVPELLARLDATVGAFVGTAAYRAIHVKWHGGPRPVRTIARTALLMGVGVVLVLIGMAWWRHRSVLKLNRELRATIAERETAQQALRESGERFRRIFGNSSEATMPSGGKRTIETANIRLDEDQAADEEDLMPDR